MLGRGTVVGLWVSATFVGDSVFSFVVGDVDGLDALGVLLGCAVLPSVVGLEDELDGVGGLDVLVIVGASVEG